MTYDQMQSPAVDEVRLRIRSIQDTVGWTSELLHMAQLSDDVQLLLEEALEQNLRISHIDYQEAKRLFVDLFNGDIVHAESEISRKAASQLMARVSHMDTIERTEQLS